MVGVDYTAHRGLAVKSKLLFIASGLLVLFAAILLGGINKASAQATSPTTGPNGFLISPVITEITVAKGASQTVLMSVTNPTKLPVVAKATTNDFVASADESGNPRLILNQSAPKPKNDFTSLVSPIPNLKIAPLQRVYLNITITVPKIAYSGGYYGAIRFTPVNNGQKSNVGLTASVGSLFLITVPGNLTRTMSLVQLASVKKTGNNTYANASFFNSGQVFVMNRLEDTGNIQIQPFGTVWVKNIFGKQVASYQFNNTSPRSNVLPSSIRKFVDPLSKKIDWFGRYTITESLAPASGSGDLTIASATFWYFPTWFLLTFFAVLAILVLDIIYWIFIRPKRRKKHHHQSQPQNHHTNQHHPHQ